MTEASNSERALNNALNLLTFISTCARQDQFGCWVIKLDEQHINFEQAKAFADAVQAAYTAYAKKRAGIH